MSLLQSQQILKVGQEAPEFELSGVDGEVYTLSQFKNKPVLVVFMCNHCPYVKPQIGEIKRLSEKYKNKIVVIGVNANDAKQYPEDSFDKMIETAAEHHFNFFYLHDMTQEVARAYGAQCTPDPFLLDKEHKLAWHGRLNDALDPDQKPTKHDMDEAMAELLKAGKVSKPFLPSQGCSVKWK